MARGKKGYRARSFAGYRRQRVAPRGRMSVGGSWVLYVLVVIGLLILAGLIWQRFK
jgi:hypothetical protein